MWNLKTIINMLAGTLAIIPWAAALTLEYIVHSPEHYTSYIEQQRLLREPPNYYVPQYDDEMRKYKDYIYVVQGETMMKAYLMRHKLTKELSYVLEIGNGDSYKEICYPLNDDYKLPSSLI